MSFDEWHKLNVKKSLILSAPLQFISFLIFLLFLVFLTFFLFFFDIVNFAFVIFFFDIFLFTFCNVFQPFQFPLSAKKKRALKHFRIFCFSLYFESITQRLASLCVNFMEGIMANWMYLIRV